MNKTLIVASLAAATFTASAVLASERMTPGERTADQRVRCEQMTGNDRLACLDQVKKREGQSSRTDDGTTRQEKRTEARDSVMNPANKCDKLTGTDRLACQDQQRDATSRR